MAPKKKMGAGRALARRHKYFRVAKKRKKKRVSMCQPLSDYYYKLDSKSRARYDDKISYIGNRDP